MNLLLFIEIHSIFAFIAHLIGDSLGCYLARYTARLGSYLAISKKKLSKSLLVRVAFRKGTVWNKKKAAFTIYFQNARSRS
jgi:hypothetical protein